MSTAKSDLNALTSDAAYYLMDPLNKLLREMSQAAGWPNEVTQALYVDFDGETLSVAYPDDMTDEIMDLEYGRGSKLPNSVIRAFIYRSSGVIKTVLSSKTADALFELEEVF